MDKVFAENVLKTFGAKVVYSGEVWVGDAVYRGTWYFEDCMAVFLTDNGRLLFVPRRNVVFVVENMCYILDGKLVCEYARDYYKGFVDEMRYSVEVR